MNLSKPKAIMKTVVISQFNYCLLVWMFHSRKLDHCINSIHEREREREREKERELRVTSQGYKSTFFQLLQKGNSVTIHQRNLQVLAAEIFNAKKDLLPEVMYKVFELKEPFYSLWYIPH